MRGKVIIPKNDYESYYIPFKDIVSVMISKKISIKAGIMLELERLHPFFDVQSQLFFKLVFVEKKLYILAVIMEAGVLGRYEIHKHLYICGKKPVRVFYQRSRIIIAAAVCMVLLLFGIIPCIHEDGNINNPNTGYYAAAVSPAEEKKEKAVDAGLLFSIISQIIAEEKCMFDELSVVYDAQSMISDVSIKITGLFPEKLEKYFDNEILKTLSIDEITYTKNEPTVTLQMKADTESYAYRGMPSLSSLRNIVLSAGETVFYEHFSPKELHVGVHENNFRACLASLINEAGSVPLSKIFIKKKQNTIEVHFYSDEQSISLLSISSFTDLVFLLSKTTNPSSAVRKTAVYTDIETQRVIGKISDGGGSRRIFYKTEEGRLRSEVQN